MTAMMFYTELVPLNDQTHAALRLAPVSRYGFAAQANSVPMLLPETAECAREFPIVFAGPAGAAVPAVLLGLRERENLQVDAAGRWLAHYVPAFIRRYPFALGNDAAGQALVCIDAQAACLGTAAGDALFDQGVPTQKLQQTMAFLRDFQAAAERTAALGQRIEALGLLREADSLAQLKDGRQFRLGGLRVIDEARLDALADAEVLELARSGALKLIHAHLISLGHLGRLVDRLSERSRPAPGAAGKSRAAAMS